MPEEIKNIFDDVIELKKANLWLVSFALTDNEVKEIIKLISRVIIGSMAVEDFFDGMKKIIRKDESIIKKITISAIKSRFLPLKDQISGVDELLNELGSYTDIDIEPKKTEQNINNNTHIIFSPDDDNEIKQILSTASPIKYVHDYLSLAESIIAESGFSSDGDEVILARLKNIIIARLKDIRDELETAEALKKSRKIGGLEMADEQAKKIITLTKDKINQGLASLLEEKMELNNSISFPSKKPFHIPKTTLAAIRNNHQSQTPIIELKKVEPYKIEKPKPVVMPEIIEEDGLPVIKYPQGDDLMIKPKVIGFKKEAINQVVKLEIPIKLLPVTPVLPVAVTPLVENVIPVSTPEPRPMSKSTPPPRNIRFGKPTVDGVLVGGLLVGPVEELGIMTLINFRRLGETPHNSIAKIKEKIQLLEKDSYAKKLAGIDAWHKSEVNRFYRLLGQESMRQERSIDDIINERINANKPTLSIEEFNSIMALNKDLRY